MKKDFINQKFNKWTILKELEPKKYVTNKRNVLKRVFLCVCECGNTKNVLLENLKRGISKSCGCLIKENSGIRTHGMSKTSEYHIWNSIKERCNNPKNHAYKYYGGRGISFYDKWENNFIEFYNYIGTRPSKYHSIDRIDVNGNYEPGNIKWATRKEQSRNLRSNINITINGETKCINAWCDVYNISRATVKSRISYGWDLIKAITHPIRKNSLSYNESDINFSEEFLALLDLEIKNMKHKNNDNFIIEKLKQLVKSKL